MMQKIAQRKNLFYFTAMTVVAVFALFLFVNSGGSQVMAASCQNECDYSGFKKCTADGLGYQYCGNYDSDVCLDWSSIYYCGWGKVCNSAVSCVSSCQNECLYSGEKKCSDDGQGYQLCGNYDSDKCLEWSYAYYCRDGKTCSGGECVFDCQQECGYAGQSYCSSSGESKICGYYDADPCLDWKTISCTGSTECGYGKCTATQRPYWKCWNGKCEFECRDSSSCQASGGGTNSHNSLACYDGDVYWYSSSGLRNDKKEDCGSYYCGSWSGPFCLNDGVYRERNCYTPSCVGDKCANTANKTVQLLETCQDGNVCSGGRCVEKSIQCSSGVCCNDGQFKNQASICNSQAQIQYGCPWGTALGVAVGKQVKTKYQYCSGDSGECAGLWTDWSAWSNWLINDNCSSNEKCVVGNALCQKVSQPSGGPAAPSKPDPTPEIEPVVDDQDKTSAYIGFGALWALLVNWVFWFLVAMVAITLLITKRMDLSERLAQRRLCREIAKRKN